MMKKMKRMVDSLLILYLLENKRLRRRLIQMMIQFQITQMTKRVQVSPLLMRQMSVNFRKKRRRNRRKRRD